MLQTVSSKSNSEKELEGLDSVVDSVPGICEALGPILTTLKKGGKKKRIKDVVPLQ